MFFEELKENNPVCIFMTNGMRLFGNIETVGAEHLEVSYATEVHMMGDGQSRMLPHNLYGDPEAPVAIMKNSIGSISEMTAKDTIDIWKKSTNQVQIVVPDNNIIT